MKRIITFILSSLMVFSLLFGNIFNITKAEAFSSDNGIKIALKSIENGKFVCAEDSGNSPLVANRDQAKQWETFEVVRMGHDKIALKSMENGKFVCADHDGNSPLIANRDHAGRRGTFEVVHMGHDKIALKSVVNGKFVNVDEGSLLIANSDHIRRGEIFKVIEFE